MTQVKKRDIETMWYLGAAEGGVALVLAGRRCRAGARAGNLQLRVLVVRLVR